MALGCSSDLTSTSTDLTSDISINTNKPSPFSAFRYPSVPQVSVWRALFGKDKLEQANDYDKIYYIIEKEPLINAFTSVPKENSTLNCAAFTGGAVEAILTHSGFSAKVTVHRHKCTTLMIKFDEAVIARGKALEGRKLVESTVFIHSFINSFKGPTLEADEREE
jgi:hypothetical protein